MSQLGNRARCLRAGMCGVLIEPGIAETKTGSDGSGKQGCRNAHWESDRRTQRLGERAPLLRTQLEREMARQAARGTDFLVQSGAL